MLNYQRAKIYTLRNRNDKDLIYVGCCVTELFKKLKEHKYNALDTKFKFYDHKVYQKMHELGSFDAWYIELYEDCPCENKDQLMKRRNIIARDIGTLN